jgi:Fe-S cluster assembly protein SufD
MTAPVEERQLPSFKGVPGWEFTPLKGLDIDAFGDAAGETTRAQGAEELSRDEEKLGTIAREGFFAARNDEAWTEGTIVRVPANTKLDEPIRIETVQTQAGTTLNHRTLIIVEDGAEAEVWDTLTTGHDEAGLLNGVVEMHVGANATLRYISVQDVNEKSWVFGSQRGVIERDGNLNWTVIGFGGANGKVFQETTLAGPGADAKVTGAYATHGKQHVDFDTLQEHAAPNTTSDLAFRGIVGGRSSAVWRGMIKVDPGAQKTDAFQEARNLLIGPKAHADAIPGLEILADDVACTHAAAIAKIDAEQIFYLRSHGLPQAQAERVVVEGFLGALVERYTEGPLRDSIGKLIDERLELVLN